MTVVHAFTSYGGVPYGSVPYGGGLATGTSGLQFTSVIISDDDQGIQFLSQSTDSLKPQGIQFLSDTADFLGPQGVSFFATNLGFACLGYGQIPYGSRSYLTPQCEASAGIQFSPTGSFAEPVGTQFESLIVDALNSQGIQFESQILDFLEAQGIQEETKIVDFLKNNGLQYTGQIVNALNNQGLQFEIKINSTDAQGFQFEAISVEPEGLQFTVNLYNTNRLRVLCEFPSRGASVTGGPVNAWGNASGEGLNWLANDQAAGDFETFRLNTDIVEEVWRSNTAITGVNLDCDTEIAQGVFLDTLAILNHNLTTSAVITLIGSNSSTFAPIGVTRVLPTRETNVYHIEEDLPFVSFRYWRIQINDPTNTNSFLEIGTILFGASQIFQGECMIDRILKRTRHFADSVRTEGFTSVKNDRSIKDAVTLTFEKLEFSKGNFQTLSAIFKTARTSQKCLWIPTPSPTDPSFNERFAVFAKLTEIPEQQHQVMGEEEGDYISLVIELDESE